MSVRAADLSSYLASKGWQRDGDWRGASVWRLDEQARLLVPDIDPRDDADQLIEEAVAKIARYEERPVRDVRQDIAQPMTDAQYFRLHPGSPSGSIPLPAGVKAAQGILDLLRAAASATEQGPQLLFEGHRTPKVDDFLHRVLLGSAAPGSYVLTARVTADAIGSQQLDLFTTTTAAGRAREFSGRAVITSLHASVRAARTAAAQAVRDHGELDAFTASEDQVLSANTCRALSDLGGEGRNHPFEIGFSWARGVPGAERGILPDQEIRFSSSMPAILARAANELTALAHSGTARIRGEITKIQLDRFEPPRVKVKGHLVLASQEQGPRRTLWVRLDRADQGRAQDALDRVLEVEAAGDLTTVDRRLELRASTFRVAG